MRVLGIESSCDDTGVAIYDSNAGLLSQALHSQIVVHQEYGGVVPELASRDHIKWVVSLVKKVLQEANLAVNDVDAIAYTAGPGLIGALLVGACFAKSFAWALKKPAIAIHHLEAHILAAKLDNPHLDYPFLALLVSGGHTQLILARALNDYQLLGDTLDDAVGEAFDKTAKLMGLPYPGGAALSQLADDCPEALKNKLPPFPRPMTQKPGLNFSFSGLKTHALVLWHKIKERERAPSMIAHAFQEAIVETLVMKCKRALEQTHVNNLVVAGGVGANRLLRSSITAMGVKMGKTICFPRHEYCTDNGAMVAYAGCLHYLDGRDDEEQSIVVKPRWALSK